MSKQERRQRRRKVLEDIINRDPSSAEADVARIRLKEMDDVDAIIHNVVDEDDFFKDSTNKDLDPDNILVCATRFEKYLDRFRYLNTTSFKEEFKTFLKRKKWIKDDVIIPEMSKKIREVKNEFLLIFVLKSIYNEIHELGFYHRNYTVLTPDYKKCTLLKNRSRILEIKNKTAFCFNDDYTTIMYSADLQTQKPDILWKDYTKNQTLKKDFIVIEVTLLDEKKMVCSVDISVDGDKIIDRIIIDPDAGFSYWSQASLKLIYSFMNSRAKFHYVAGKRKESVGIKRNKDEVLFDELF